MADSGRKILSLSAALAAMSGPALATTTTPATIGDTEDTTPDAAARQMLKIPVGEDLMSFTVSEKADGMIVADHSSHASHSSHSSHASHASHTSSR